MRNCGDCNAAPGDFHIPGCDVERCARCGGQSISCDCIYEVCGMNRDTLEEEYPEVYNNGPTDAMYAKWDAEWGPRRMPWTGEWPGEAECREYGFWAVFGPEMNPPQVGWVTVPEGTPKASENLNRLIRECSWNVDKQRWIRDEVPPKA